MIERARIYPKPVRLQLSRRKGFNLQRLSRETNGLEAMRVARPSLFGNPFVIGKDGDRAECVARFKDAIYWAQRDPANAPTWATRIRENLSRLRGGNLACYCSLDGPCHAEVLLELANK
jgi:hypothetical protein